MTWCQMSPLQKILTTFIPQILKQRGPLANCEIFCAVLEAHRKESFDAVHIDRALQRLKRAGVVKFLGQRAGGWALVE